MREWGGRRKTVRGREDEGRRGRMKGGEGGRREEREDEGRRGRKKWECSKHSVWNRMLSS